LIRNQINIRRSVSSHHGTTRRCKANADFFIVYSPAKEDVQLRAMAEQNRSDQSFENV